ncbi:MAG: hypothetical protein ENTB_02668 [Enterocloster aldenensis]
MMNVTVQMVVYCVILVLLAIPLGSYMGKVMNGEHVFYHSFRFAQGTNKL